MAEANHNIWAPWRMEYIHQLHEQPGENAQNSCFLCDYVEHPDDDAKNHVIWRTDCCLTLFNRFPYTNGHLLIAPRMHVPELSDLDERTLTDLMLQVRDAQRLLKETTQPQGFNIGMNFGRCAGAGLPDHLHIHIVPRWSGDTNFMPVIADVRVIPQSIETLHQLMREASVKLGLPGVR